MRLNHRHSKTMNTELEKQIETAYSLLRAAVVERREEFASEKFQTFADIISADRYTTPKSLSPLIARFSIIALHTEWQYVYQTPVLGSTECLGDLCRRLTTEGLQVLDLTWAELRAIREEVLYEGDYYSSYIDAVEQYELDYSNTKSYESAFLLCKLYLRFDRLSQAKDFLSLISSSFGTEPDANIDYAILSAIYYEKKFSFDFDEDKNSFDDLPEIKKVLSIFPKNDDSNRVIGQYDPTVYWRQWLKLIDLYFSIRESAWNKEQENEEPIVASVFTDAPDSRNGTRTAILRFDTEFAASLDSEDLDLLRKHDSILLELVPYCPEEYHTPLSYLYSPIFRGTEILLWHKKLHLTYPGKLDEFLSDVPNPQKWHDWNITEDQLKLRLLREFPSRQEEINGYFDSSDSDEIEDDESLE